MSKRILALALLAVFAGGLSFAKKAKAVDGDAVTKQEAKAAKKEAKQNAKEAKKDAKEAKKAEKIDRKYAKKNKGAVESPAKEEEAQGNPLQANPLQEGAAQEPAASDSSAQEAAAAGEGSAESADAQQKDSNVTAVVKRIGGDVALQDGVVRMETVRESGAVLFYVVNGKKIYPALKPSEYGQTNYLSLFCGAKEYRLNKNGHCAYSYDVNSRSISETLTVKDVAEVKAFYELGKYSPKDEAANSVRVRISVKNLAGKKTPLALKAVYNLCLGENRQAHYSTAVTKAIGSEYVLIPSKEEGWIISSDGQNAIEFIVFGKGVTPPKKAVMANKDVIELATPITLFNPGNTFNSILSYNDSSLALFWDPVELEKDAVANYSFIVNFSDSDFQNSGKEIFAEDEENVPATNLRVTTGKEPAPSGNDPDQIPTAIEGVDPSKLNMEYVQQLIDHINSLEQGDPSLNKMKIQQLQTEVDEVLKVLRSRK